MAKSSRGLFGVYKNLVWWGDENSSTSKISLEVISSSQYSELAKSKDKMRGLDIREIELASGGAVPVMVAGGWLERQAMLAL